MILTAVAATSDLLDLDDHTDRPLASNTTVINALAQCLYAIEIPITNGADLFCMVLDDGVAKSKYDPFVSAAQELADFWRLHFVRRRLLGESHNTKWQQGVIDLITDLHRPITQRELKLLVTLPRYTHVQKTYYSWAENFKSVDLHNGYDPSRFDLTFVEKLEKKRKGTPTETWYAFTDIAKHLIILPVNKDSFKHTNFFATPLLDRMLKIQNGNLQLTANIIPARIADNFYAGKISFVSDFH
jgi:hypothetical protein